MVAILTGRQLLSIKVIIDKTTKLFLRVASGIIIFTGITITAPAISDLGAADTHSAKEELNQTQFNAWCVEKYADCLATFDKGRLMIDEGKGISSNQVIKWSRKDIYRRAVGWINFIGPHHLYTYTFQYKSSDGVVKEAKIMFQNTKYADRFYGQLKDWAPSQEYKCVYNFDKRKEIC